jgi:hypothetical protein
MRQLATCAFLAAACSLAFAQSPADVRGMASLPRSEMEPVLRGFDADRGALMRAFPASDSPEHAARLRAYYESTIAGLDAMPFDSMSLEAKVDWVMLRNFARHSLHQLDVAAKELALTTDLVPFAPELLAFAEARRRITPGNPRRAADDLDALRVKVDEARRRLSKALDEREEAPAAAERSAARRSWLLLERLRRSLRDWHAFRDGYDPLFSWWTREPFKAAEQALDAHAALIKERLMGVTAQTPDPIIGVPIGREALEAELRFAMIPYTPEELLAIGEREFAWCQAELMKAAASMNCGDDWRKALELTKQAHVEPGEQPALIRELADDAVRFLKANDLITVPPMAEETWRMEMMSPERQRVAPFFLGGESIIVSFPTDSMCHADKCMSMRGNNRHFAHATVFHELIPGHHLQQFMNARSMVHRAMFDTPFWTEGWALHWEMLMWDRGYHATPMDRMGALFWRTHRCARIVFSIKFHLGEMTPRECVDLLVDRVGHERANAEGEVRRSLSGDYGPTYQLAYMVGGLQFRALHKELVGSGRMTDRDFHDAIIKGNAMPVEMVRALLTRQAPARDFVSSWRFDEALNPPAAPPSPAREPAR